MKIHFWSVGKAHETYVKQGIELFTKRISHYYPVSWKIFPPAKNPDSSDTESAKKQEATMILQALAPDDVLIALDERGKMLSSTDLADLIQKIANQSTRNLIFLIGGAYGIHSSVLEKARFSWSLSDLVFPHQIVRLLLAEQIYRACTILRNEKYHHE